MIRLHRLAALWNNIRWLFREKGLHRDLNQLHRDLNQLAQRLDELEPQIAWLRQRAQAMQRQERSQAWVYGHRMRLDPDDTVISPRLSEIGWFEPLETELVQRVVRPGSVVVDVGANIGYYTLHFARLVGPEGHVFAFEPDPRNFDLLRKNVRQNGYTNVTLVRKAVASRSGMIRLFQNPENRGDHRTYASEAGRESIEVEAIRLDDFFADYPRNIDVLKFDIQGAEADAFRGMQHLLDRQPHLRIITEFWPRGLHLAGHDPRAFLEELLRRNFQIHIIDEQAEQLVPLDVRTLLERLPVEPDTDILFTNLYCERRAA